MQVRIALSDSLKYLWILLYIVCLSNQFSFTKKSLVQLLAGCLKRELQSRYHCVYVMYEKVCAYGTSPMGYLRVYINFTTNRKGTRVQEKVNVGLSSNYVCQLNDKVSINAVQKSKQNENINFYNENVPGKMYTVVLLV